MNRRVFLASAAKPKAKPPSVKWRAIIHGVAWTVTTTGPIAAGHLIATPKKDVVECTVTARTARGAVITQHLKQRK